MEKRILLIDDELFFRQVMTDALSEAGFDVTAVTSGEAGLEAMKRENFDLLITDAVLPGLDGFRICRKAKEKQADMPVFIVSALYRKAEHEELALGDCGADAFITKPVQFPDLVRKVKETLEGGAGGPSRRSRDLSAPGRIYESGDLGDVSFPSILHSIYADGVTGRLHVTKGKFRKCVFFRNGYPHYVRSNMLIECLGRMLVKAGRISESDCDKSILIAKSTNRFQGTVLVEMGALTPHELKRALVHQLKEKLLNIFQWEEGAFRFEECDSPAVEEIALHMSTAQIIVEGVRSRYSLARLKGELDKHLMEYPRLSSDPLYRFQDVNLTKEEESLLMHVDGKRSLGEILSVRRDGEGAAYGLFYSMISSGIIELLPSPLLGEADEAGKEAPKPVAGGEDGEVREKLIRDFIRIDSSDYYQVFGLERDFTAEALKSAFVRLSRRYHPDRFSGFSCPVIREKSKAIFKKISHAYLVLSDGDRRKEYDSFLENRAREEHDRKLKSVLEAEDCFKRGGELLRQNRFAEAEESFRKAVGLNGDEGRYNVYLGWAMYKRGLLEGRSCSSKAKELIKKGIALDPAVGFSHYFLGSIYKAEGLMELAQREFEKEIQVNPDCTEALRELRLLDMRQGKRGGGDRKRGVLGRIFR